MVKSCGVVAIVPARGGSKSILRKNVKLFGGAPLLTYSIAAGLTARLVDRVIVSTDDDEVATVARRFGAEVPFMRPPALAQDATPDLPVFQHALTWLETHEACVPDIVVHLRPTSPIRPPDCVDAAIELLRMDPRADSVRAVVAASQNPYKMWRMHPDGALEPLLDSKGGEPYNRPRQELPSTYWQTGHVDAIRSTTIRHQGSMTGTRIKALVVDGAYTCDIDTDADWQRAEWMLRHLTRTIVRPPLAKGSLPADVRLVVFDFDGVMTDNRVWVTSGGEESVACNRSDGLGLDAVRRLGVQLFVLSTERDPVVGARCRKLGVDCEQGVSDKVASLRALMSLRGIDPSQVVYVGNDVNDLECMQLVGCSMAVADAHPEVLVEADLILERSGGHGAVREVCDRICAALARGEARSPGVS